MPIPLKELHKIESTRSPMQIPVDYNGSSVDPETVLFSQAEVDRFLTEKGATAFKHFEAAWNATPRAWEHNVDFLLASGVHRPLIPLTGPGAWSLKRKVLGRDVFATINGEADAFEELTSSFTITAFSNAALNPFADFSGIASPIVDAWRGLKILFNTGQLVTVHSNTTSRAYVIDKINGSPTSGKLVRSGTILRNSIDDINKLGQVLMNGLVVCDEMWNNGVEIYDLTFEPMQATYCLDIRESTLTLMDCIIDFARVKDDYSVVPPRGQAVRAKLLWLAKTSIRGSGLATIPNASPKEMCASAIEQWWDTCYVGGCDTSVYPYLYDQPCIILPSDVVIDQMLSSGVSLEAGGRVIQNDWGIGRRATVRDCPIGFDIKEGSEFHCDTDTKLWFENMSGPCFKLGDRAQFIARSADSTIENGPAGGNTDVGFEFASHAVRAAASLKGTISADGSVGDIRMSDGTIKNYTDAVGGLESADGRQNLIFS